MCLEKSSINSLRQKIFSRFYIQFCLFQHYHRLLLLCCLDIFLKLPINPYFLPYLFSKIYLVSNKAAEKSLCLEACYLRRNTGFIFCVFIQILSQCHFIVLCAEGRIPPLSFKICCKIQPNHHGITIGVKNQKRCKHKPI